MTEFNEGWFNAFGAFYDTLKDNGGDTLAENFCHKVAQYAAVTEAEIKAVLNSDLVSDECKVYLKAIKL